MRLSSAHIRHGSVNNRITWNRAPLWLFPFSSPEAARVRVCKIEVQVCMLVHVCVRVCVCVCVCMGVCSIKVQVLCKCMSVCVFLCGSTC